VPDVERIGPSSWRRWRALRLRSLEEAPDAFGSSLARERAYGEAEWRSHLGASWIAVADGIDVGLVAGGSHTGSNLPWVYAMWVAPESRGTGVAEALLGAVVEWARSSGAAVLGLDVADRAPRARRCYERFGFVAGTTTFPMPRDPGITLTEMFLDLSSPEVPPR
jgi:GNAT superfamily N-acetyltransferase